METVEAVGFMEEEVVVTEEETDDSIGMEVVVGFDPAWDGLVVERFFSENSEEFETKPSKASSVISLSRGSEIPETAFCARLMVILFLAGSADSFEAFSGCRGLA